MGFHPQFPDEVVLELELELALEVDDELDVWLQMPVVDGGEASNIDVAVSPASEPVDRSLMIERWDCGRSRERASDWVGNGALFRKQNILQKVGASAFCEQNVRHFSGTAEGRLVSATSECSPANG